MVVCDVDQDTIGNFDREDTAAFRAYYLGRIGTVCDYYQNLALTAVITAVDGSLNSLVTMALASDALGPMRVQCTALPNKDSRAAKPQSFLPQDFAFIRLPWTTRFSRH